MIAPGVKPSRIIQIDITNRCDLRCSNCTRMLAHHQQRYDMSPEVFRQTCRVLNTALPHFVKGVFGGNPCLHPRFEDLCKIMMEEIPDQRARGLWTNHLRDKGWAAQAAFWPSAYFNLNAHTVPEAAQEFDRWLPGKMIPESRTQRAWHSPTLVAMSDFVGTADLPSEAALWAAVDQCDIDRNWSGIVIEHDGAPYLYACEVQGAFDLLYQENHGVPLTEASAQAGIDLFRHQYARWCPGCGIPMRLPGHLDLEETDDVSAHHRELLQIGIRTRRATVEARPGELPLRIGEATDYERRRS